MCWIAHTPTGGSCPGTEAISCTSSELRRQLSGDPEFALPYWDWTSAPRVPDVLFDDVLTPTHAL